MSDGDDNARSRAILGGDRLADRFKVRESPTGAVSYWLDLTPEESAALDELKPKTSEDRRKLFDEIRRLAFTHYGMRLLPVD